MSEPQEISRRGQGVAERRRSAQTKWMLGNEGASRAAGGLALEAGLGCRVTATAPGCRALGGVLVALRPRLGFWGRLPGTLSAVGT